MDKARQDKLMEKLSSNERSALNRFGESGKEKVLEMIEDGWTIEELNYSEIEMKKGYHHKIVTSSGSSYTI